jgi:hypothetical protein
MLIALDYDNTFTADTKCWREVVDVLQKHGHEVIIATSRFKLYGNYQEISESTGLNVVFCDHNAKAKTAKQYGVVPDIWIDDDPWAIVGVDKP